MKKQKNSVQIAGEVLFWIAIAVFLSVIIFMTLSAKGVDIGYQTYLIQSGSMEPSIGVGDVVVITSRESYRKGEVITFLTKDERVVTHRIVDITGKGKEKTFVTKGDANEDPDPDLESASKVRGKVVFVMPKIGFLVAFSKTKQGIFVLILIPVVIIIYDEILRIIKEVKKP